ncbi:MAG: cobalamin biosynthesis protein [Chloroflexi bacterium]|nr:cobalamin biosynthesis protein [Chloroflexota bacterium]
MDILLILSLALIIDLALGEPSRFIHPVVWMGKVISLLERVNVGRYPFVQFLYGFAITLTIIGLFTAPVYFALLYLESLNFVVYVIVGAVLLKSTFSLRELWQVARRVKRLLMRERLDEARCELCSLVSRDTQSLPKPLLVSATVESVAESTCDSFVAPIFYFLLPLLFGVPGLFGVLGAIAYRVVNTLDAMVGYRGKYEYLGKFASKLDDVLNFIPARLTALLLALATFLSRRATQTSWRVLLGEHSKTESPNAGWPIAAMAGGLNVQLEKVGHYRLGNSNSLLVPETIDAALKLVQVAVLAWVLICFIAGGIHFAVTT